METSIETRILKVGDLIIITQMPNITLSLIFVFYLLFFFVFYLLCKESLKDPAIEEVLESGSAELYLTVTPILVILFMTTPSFALL